MPYFVNVTTLLLAATTLGATFYAAPSAVRGEAELSQQGRAAKREASIEVVLHGVDEALRAEVSSLVQAAAKHAESVLGHGPGRGDVLTAHLYAEEEDYLEASQRLSGGAFDANLAFANWDTKSAHVLLQPAMSPEALERLGVPYQTRVLLAHETTHLVRYSALPNHRSNPSWFADGLGQLVALDLTHGGRSLDDIPWEASGRAVLLDLAQAGELPSVEDIVHGRDSGLPPYTRYALRLCFVQFLRDELGERTWSQVRDTIVSTGGGHDVSAPVSKVLAKQRDLDPRFERWVRSASPRWREAVRSAWWIEAGLAQVGWDSVSAHLWREGRLPEGAFEVRGNATVLPSGRTQLNLRFEREAGGFYQVSFVAGQGLVFFLFDPEEDWVELGRSTDAALKLGEPFDFSVAWVDGRLDVQVGASEVRSMPLEHGSISGRLALSAQAGAAGIWHRVEVLDPAVERPEAPR